MKNFSGEKSKKGGNSGRRSGIRIMGQAHRAGAAPCSPVMLLAIVLGTAGYLCAIFLTIRAGYGLMQILSGNGAELTGTEIAGVETPAAFGVVLSGVWVLVVLALMRGILHYGEQYCNHFIAFKLLAIIRHKVFAALRRLCPARLEGRDKGNLISVLTSDIELLEVFYAHTISPIAIAVCTSLVMLLFFSRISAAAAVLALVGISDGGFGDSPVLRKQGCGAGNGLQKCLRRFEQLHSGFSAGPG